MNKRIKTTRHPSLFVIINLMIINITLSSCGLSLKEEQVKEYSVNAQLEPYVQQYISKKRQYSRNFSVDDLKVSFAELQYPTLGVCYTGSSSTKKFLKTVVKKTPRVEININEWSSMSESQRQALMAHELGHCLEKRNHENQTLGSRPASVMHKYLINGSTFRNYYDYYMKELFNQLNNNSLAYNYNDSDSYAATVIEESENEENYFYHKTQVGEEGIDDCVYANETEIIIEEDSDEYHDESKELDEGQ